MTVNDLARRVGIPAHVVRYYSERGFLSPTRNARNAYRQYGDADLHRLRFICRAKALGFTLKEIGVILKAADGQLTARAEIVRLVQARALAVETQIADAARLHRRIRETVEGWSLSADATSLPADCRKLIDAMAAEE
jgi:DNA-binding transcriptional MerR regulator